MSLSNSTQSNLIDNNRANNTDNMADKNTNSDILNQDQQLPPASSENLTAAERHIDAQTLQQAASDANALLNAVSQAVIGRDTVVRQLCVCILASGHALIEGLPGLGKTLMVKAYAKAIAGSYHRVQFTPDLMPADITGHTLYDMQTGQWKVRRGPVFCNLLLATNQPQKYK